MLRAIEDVKRKKEAQTRLEMGLKSKLVGQGRWNIGFPGGHTNTSLFSMAPEKLWAAFLPPDDDSNEPRFWNAFGVFKPDAISQNISVEINIPVDNNTARVAGFFAEDITTGDIFLMHSGKIGGGRKGIGKTAFLVWSNAMLVEVACDNNELREGIPVCRLDDPHIAESMWRFVKTVAAFKEVVSSGTIETTEFRQRVEAFERYRREYSGKKSGSGKRTIEYFTFHGDVVDALYVERSSKCEGDERVFNSVEIDLYVEENRRRIEVFEVKTSTDRQSLYTGIGQLVTHAPLGAQKYLVLPSGESIPADIDEALQRNSITVRRFKLRFDDHEVRVYLE